MHQGCEGSSNVTVWVLIFAICTLTSAWVLFDIWSTSWPGAWVIVVDTVLLWIRVRAIIVAMLAHITLLSSRLSAPWRIRWNRWWSNIRTWINLRLFSMHVPCTPGKHHVCTTGLRHTYNLSNLSSTARTGLEPVLISPPLSLAAMAVNDLSSGRRI